MLSLSEKHSYDQQIIALKADLLESRTECKRLTRRNNVLQAKVSNNVFSGEDLAVSLIEKRIAGLKITLQEISNRSGLSYNNVRNVSSRLTIRHKRGLSI
tara:strand:+ start:203 stop:502 length:300 start_codon:yes stop_codon:yes gene_type:complete